MKIEKSESGGFIQLNRSAAFWDIIKGKKYHNTFILLTVIALRARRNDSFNTDGLRAGEALVGDYASYGLTEREYRTAKTNLEKWRFSTFKGTGKGTIAKICSSIIYNINLESKDGQKDEQATDERRTSDEPETTNNKENKEKKEKKEINIPFDEFWTAYDKKEGSKIDTLKKWEKLTDNERSLIMAGIKHYAKSFREKQYQPLATTFLNQKRWEAETYGGNARVIALNNPNSVTLTPEQSKLFNRFNGQISMLSMNPVQPKEWLAMGMPTKDEYLKCLAG